MITITDDAAREWIHEGVAALETAPVVQRDWDGFPGGRVELPSAKRALHVFAVMVETLLALDRPDLQALMVMPLAYSTRFIRRAPNFAAFVERPWLEGYRREMAGAGYHLCRREGLGWHGDWEYYQRAIDVSGVWQGPPITALYTVHRSPEWPEDEFSRAFQLYSPRHLDL